MEGDKLLWHVVLGNAGLRAALFSSISESGCLETLADRQLKNSGRWEIRGSAPTTHCSANGDIVHIAGACSRSLGTGNLSCYTAGLAHCLPWEGCTGKPLGGILRDWKDAGYEMGFYWCKHSQMVWFSPGKEERLGEGTLKRLSYELWVSSRIFGSVHCDGTSLHALAASMPP